MEATIEMQALTKRYGRTVAVDDLSIAVRPGRVTGFVGPNGAGKTTTMQLLLGLAAPQSGEALVTGRRYVDIERPLTVVGALLDAGAVHPGRSARSHLGWIAESNGIARGRPHDVLRLVGLSGVAGRRAGTFSLGMRQRLGIAAALLGDPPILVLDEPTVGLDPEGIRWMRETLRALADEGRTIFVSSHLMSELEDTADHLIVIGKGRLLADLPVDQLIATASDGQVAITTPDVAAAMTVLANAGATPVSNGRDRVTVQGIAASQVSQLLASNGIALEQLVSTRATLEEAYFRLTRDAEEHSRHGRRPVGGRTVTATFLSECTKLRTQRGARIAFASMCVLMVAMSALAASESHTDAVFRGDDDVVQIGLAGIVFAALAAVVAGASPMTSEYSTRMIRTTLTATQGRLRVLAAKAAVVAGVSFLLALGASAAAYLISQSLLHERGYVAPVYPPVSITDPEAARAVVGTALLLTAYCLIALGIGTALRHSGASIAAGIGLVFVPLLILGVFPEHIPEHIVQATPLAGMAVQSTSGRMLSAFGDVEGMPIGPWQGLGVAYSWAFGSLAVGYVLLRRRDA